MERRANAILNGRKRSTILSIASKTKSNETSSSELKKNKYTFSLLKKGNRQNDSDAKLNYEAKNHQTTKVKHPPYINKSLAENDLVEINKSTSQGPTDDSAFMSTPETISNSGKLEIFETFIF